MLLKRFLTIATLSAFLLTSLAACSKGSETQDDTLIPTFAVSEDESENSNPVEDVITIGGAFARDNAYLSFGIVESSWKVSGYLFPEEEGAEPLVLSGTADFEGRAELSYTDDNNKLTFVFAADSVTVTVDKGSDYAAFAGTYERTETEDPDSVILSPEQGSEAEILGRIALTHYMLNTGDSGDSIDVTALKFDSDYMEAFLLAYADLFLVDKAEPLPEVSDKYLCYTFTEDALDDLFRTVSAGTFTTEQFKITNSGIVSKDGNYYVPCLGKISGGLTISSEAAAEGISLGGVVSKPDGTRYDLTMTISTKENSAAGSVGVQILSVDYKLTK